MTDLTECRAMDGMDAIERILRTIHWTLVAVLAMFVVTSAFMTWQSVRLHTTPRDVYDRLEVLEVERLSVTPKDVYEKLTEIEDRLNEKLK